MQHSLDGALLDQKLTTFTDLVIQVNQCDIRVLRSCSEMVHVYEVEAEFADSAKLADLPSEMTTSMCWSYRYRVGLKIL